MSRKWPENYSALLWATVFLVNLHLQTFGEKSFVNGQIQSEGKIIIRLIVSGW